MAKSKEAKDSEWYKGIIREQKKEIKNLKQRIRQLEKSEHLYNNPRQYIPKEYDDEALEELSKCEQCGKGFIKEIEMVGRVFEVCSLCDYRSKAKAAKRRKING